MRTNGTWKLCGKIIWKLTIDFYKRLEFSLYVFGQIFRNFTSWRLFLVRRINFCILLVHTSVTIPCHVISFWMLWSFGSISFVLSTCYSPYIGMNGLSFCIAVFEFHSRLQGQLFKLMQQLENTTPHFIRCIKPNNKQRPGIYEKDLVLDQLRWCGVLDLDMIVVCVFSRVTFLSVLIDGFLIF